MGKRPLGDYAAAIAAALQAQDVKAVPALLVIMAGDGYGHEAEEWRRQMLKDLRSIPSLATTEEGQ